MSVSEWTEGEPFPFRHGNAATLSPHAGTAFGLVLIPHIPFIPFVFHPPKW